MKPMLLSTAITLLSLAPASAQEIISQSADGSISLSGSAGFMTIDAKEFVYDGDFKLSQLNWESKGVVVFTGTLAADLNPQWSLKADLDFGKGGDGHMVDYDWIAPNNTGNGSDDWSDRSISPDNRLAYYFSSSIELERRLYGDDTSSFGLNGGLKYTDIKWDSYGGSYIYSDAGPRDKIGTFPDGEPGISYRQRIPVGFVGIDASHSIDAFTFIGGVQGGLTSGINDTDNHWMRALRFDDRMDVAPVVMVNLQFGYDMSERTSLFVSGSYEKVFRERGDTDTVDTSTGASQADTNSAGASFQSMAVKVGLKSRF